MAARSPCSTTTPRRDSDERRRPDEALLYQLIEEHWPTFVVSLCRSLRRRAKSRLGLRSVEDALFGAVTFIQRADSSLRLNVHFHCLALDGVYVRDDEGALRFHEIGAPTHEDSAVCWNVTAARSMKARRTTARPISRGRMACMRSCSTRSI